VKLKTLPSSCFLKILGSFNLLETYGTALACIGIDVCWVSGWSDARLLIVVGERILGRQVYLAESNQAENTGSLYQRTIFELHKQLFKWKKGQQTKRLRTIYKGKKVKQSRYRPGVAQRVPGS